MGKTKAIKDAAEAELQRAYSYSSNHRTELVKDQKCGCFFCMEIFSPSEIKEWCLEAEDGDEVTAVCPYCGIDAIIGEHSGSRIDAKFLKKMNERWFRSVKL